VEVATACLRLSAFDQQAQRQSRLHAIRDLFTGIVYVTRQPSAPKPTCPSRHEENRQRPPRSRIAAIDFLHEWKNL